MADRLDDTERKAIQRVIVSIWPERTHHLAAAKTRQIQVPLNAPRSFCTPHLRFYSGLDRMPV